MPGTLWKIVQTLRGCKNAPSSHSAAYESPEAIVLDEPYSANRLHRMGTVPVHVDWRACTASPPSGVS